MDKQTKKHFKLIMCIITAFIVIALSSFAYNYFRKVKLVDTIFLNDGWNIKINNVMNENVSIDNFTFDSVDKGDKVIMTTVLPLEIPAKEPVLQLLSYHSAVNIYVDGENRYSYGDDLYKEGKMTGSGYHWVRLSEDDAGKTLEIVLDVTELNSFGNFEPVTIGPMSRIYLHFLHANKFALSGGMFLMVFGWGVFLVLLPAAWFDKRLLRLGCIALFSLFMGTWLLCNSRVSQLFSNHIDVNTYVEFIVLYLAPLPILTFFKMDKNNRKSMSLLNIVIVINALFFVVAMILHKTNTAHFPATLLCFHILIIFDIIYTLIVSFRMMKSRRMSDKFFFISAVVLAIFVLMDLLRFNYSKFIDSKAFMETESFLAVGMVVFIACLVVDYCFYMYRSFYAQAENQLLKKLAYSDYLTQLSNRTMCETVFRELEEAGAEYAIISFDLNNLKTVNDTLGHISGDTLIKSFAKMLKDIFGKFGTIGRMGGDEFIVILRNVNRDWIEEKLGLLNSVIDVVNKENAENPENSVKVSTSYGYAFNDEIEEGGAKAVYKLADDRMYIMKSRMK